MEHDDNNTVIRNIEARARYLTALGNYMSDKRFTYYSLRSIVKHMLVLHNCGFANTMRDLASLLDAGVVKYDPEIDAFERVTK